MSAVTSLAESLHAYELLVAANHPDIRMLCEHISTHLAGRDLLEVELLLLEDAVSHEVVFGQDLFRPSMVDRVVDNVQSWLTVDQNTHRSLHTRLPLHLELQLSKKTDLLTSHGKSHVLRLTRAEAGIAQQLLLPAHSPPS